jgi:DNA-binding NtrC family response regulator
VILLVEDDDAIAGLETRVLSRAGWSVQSVHCVAGAVALLHQKAYRAIVLDYRLPDGEPWPVLDAANATIPRTPVIMVTAMGSEGVAAEALHRGVGDYVKKADGFWDQLPPAVNRVTQAASFEERLHISDSLFQLIAGNLSDVIVIGDLFGPQGISLQPAKAFLATSRSNSGPLGGLISFIWKTVHCSPHC